MYNVVNPDDVIEKYGADTLRMYEMFLGPLEQSKPWDTNGIEGVHKFLRKLWRLFYNRDGQLPTQIDGGLKCFGHPIGASGLRLIYEMYLQLLGRAGERQLKSPRYGLTHNLGGFPHQNVCAISIVGHYEN